MILRPSNDFGFWGFDLDRTIRFARVRCLSRHEVIERVLMLETSDDDEIDAYMYRIGELRLTPAELDFITTSMIEIARKTEDPARSQTPGGQGITSTGSATSDATRQ